MNYTTSVKDTVSPSQLITNYSAELTDWRGPMLAPLAQVDP